jgi:hypothetical protein
LARNTAGAQSLWLSPPSQPRSRFRRIGRDSQRARQTALTLFCSRTACRRLKTLDERTLSRPLRTAPLHMAPLFVL